jgi:hypothetical protein
MRSKPDQLESVAGGAVAIAVPPGTPDWITADLIRLTLKVWQKHYKEPLSIQDAVTIVLNAGQLFGVLARE